MSSVQKLVTRRSVAFRMSLLCAGGKCVRLALLICGCFGQRSSSACLKDQPPRVPVRVFNREIYRPFFI